jgi:hypothetical protein
MEIEAKPTPSGVSVGRKRRRTHASLFIVESVGFDDEDEGRLEGDILSQMLRLSGKETEYRYIRTRQELEAVLPQFASSDLRYLHISCHGNEGSLFTTLDEIPFAELGRMLRPHLNGRRLFISACQAVNADLASALMRRAGCFSIVGPATDVGFDEAAVMWAAFYHLMFKENPQAMKATSIETALTRLIDTFDVPMTYIRRSGRPPYWREIELPAG